MAVNIQETIAQAIQEALKKLHLKADVELEHPADMSHGDISCNVAMMLAKSAGENPRKLAENIVTAMPEHEWIGKVEVAGAGFINCYLSERFFTETTQHIAEHADTWGNNSLCDGKRVMVEYTDPNPFKELHIGHLVPNAVGESLARIHEYAGADVRRVTFQGDVGLHVAKAVWGLEKNGHKADDTINAQDLGKAYATGATAYEEDASVASEIKALNKTIYERSDEEINALYDKGKAASVAYFEEAYIILGSDFNHYFFESETGPLGKKTVEAHLGDIFEKSDGAVIFRGEKHGLHTRVFVNAEGLPTYESKDIGLMLAKKEWWPFDTSITVTGSEQETYFRVVTKAAELLWPDLAGSVRGVFNGMLKLTQGKMSSRTGDVISALSFITDTTKRVGERMQDVDETVAQQVAIGAIKYAILKNSIGKDILYDPVNSISLEGDTGPYIQYAHARACSILRNAEEQGAAYQSLTLTLRSNFGITDVERLLYRFPGVVERAAYEYEPHHVASYLAELASTFNSWYAREHILDNGDSEAYKLALTRAVAVTLKNGLWVLGIKAPEKM